ncbi:MAG TPA: hypothetical protein DCL35_02670 [Candidatus Omnitrophica bacterium]|nr:hypothetical protein [Candidatus Omnitrophota bacterium]
MFETYYPKRFCKEFVAAKGDSLQLTMIMAVVMGLKPAMDDWVPAQRFDAYQKACRKYGLFVETDAVFQITPENNIPLNTVGRQQLSTTKAFGSLYKKGQKKGAVHVFLSRSKDHLRQAFANGWYPLIIKNRVVDRPLADTFRYGQCLGYPACCIRFFQSHNNWYRFSYLHEAYLNTASKKGSFLCNPFNKDLAYSYIYHMPCSYRCPKTARWASRVKDLITSEEPEFARSIDFHLKRPYLVFYEQKYYAFDGVLKDRRLFYKKAFFSGGVKDNNLYERQLETGDCLFIEGKDIVILKKGRIVERIKPSEKGFAPETPFIVDFS